MWLCNANGNENAGLSTREISLVEIDRALARAGSGLCPIRSCDSHGVDKVYLSSPYIYAYCAIQVCAIYQDIAFFKAVDGLLMRMSVEVIGSDLDNCD